MNPTITVVGGGLAGLLTACHLATAGAAVVVVDSGIVGGRARSIELGGLPVNSGPRAIYRGQALHQALSDFGIATAGHTPASSGLGLVDHALQTLPTSLSSLLSTSLLPGAARKEAALIFARVTVGAFDLKTDEHISAWIDRHADTVEARALVAALARVATYCPVGFGADLDAAAALHNMRAAFTRGVHYVDGGWAVVAQALVEKARALGVVVIDHAAVVGIDGADVALKDGRVLRGDGVVVAGGPQLAEKLLGITARATPINAACLDLVVSSLPQPARRFVLGIDAPLYFSVHSPPTHDAVILHVARYGGGGRREELEAFVELVQPGWRHHLRAARYLPQMVVMHDAPVAGHRRHSVVVDERTVLAGDWLDVPGLLADATATSAKHAAQALLSSLSLRPQQPMLAA